MAKALKFGRDANGFNAFAPRPSDIKYSVTLTVGDATSITLPGTDEIYCASFRYQPGSSVFVDTTGATAEVPAGNTLTVTTSELNPASLTLTAGTEVSMITDYDTAQVSLVLWRIA